jgi:hypothetical protein
VERARRDEQDVVGLHHPVLGRDGGAFDDRQEVALHALARDVGAVHLAARRDLVHLVQEHDAVLLGGGQRLGLDVVLVQEPRGLLVGELLHRFGHGHLAQLLAARAHLLEHALDLARQLLHARRRHDLHLLRHHGDLDLDLAVVEDTLAQHLAEFLARSRVGGLEVREVDLARRRQEHVEQALLGVVGRAVAHLSRLGFAGVLHRDLDQVADDRVDVAADVAHLGELGRLDFHERRVGEAREAPRDLGLAHARRPDHQDVLRRDLVPQRLRHLLAAPPVTQGDRDGALGRLLPDDVLVELGDDLFRGHVGRHGGRACK